MQVLFWSCGKLFGESSLSYIDNILHLMVQDGCVRVQKYQQSKNLKVFVTQGSTTQLTSPEQRCYCIKNIASNISEIIFPPLCRWLLACLRRSGASSRKNLLPVSSSPPASALLVALLQHWTLQSSQAVHWEGCTTESPTCCLSCLPGADRNVKHGF